MNGKTRLAFAVGTGYLLGRRRKLRWALTLGAAAAAGRFSRDPQPLLRKGGALLRSVPELAQVAGLGKPLTAAGRAAATAAASRGVTAVTERVRRGTTRLREPSRTDEEYDDEYDEAEVEPSESRDDEEPANTYDEDPYDEAEPDDEADGTDDEADQRDVERRPRRATARTAGAAATGEAPVRRRRR